MFKLYSFFQPGKMNLFKCHKHIRLKKLKSSIVNVSNSYFCGTVIYSQNRNFFNSAGLGAKLFSDNENEFAFNIIQKIPVTDPNMFKLKSLNESISSLEEFNKRLDQDWRSKTTSEIVQCFKDSLNYCIFNKITVADNRFDKLVDGLVDHIQDLSDEELSELLQCLAKFPPTDSFKSHNFHDIWSALDDLCCWKLPSWSVEKMFHFAELWYNLRLAKLSDFIFEMADRLLKKADILSKDQLVTLFFYMKVNKRRKIPFEYRDALNRLSDHMTVDEMAVCAMAFNSCKTSNRFYSTLSKMIEKLKNEAKHASSITASAICGLLRYSSHPSIANEMIDLLDVLTEEIDRLSNVCCMHIALLGTGLQFFHEKSIVKISHKLVKDFGDTTKIRLKDIERLLLVLTMFNYDPKTEPDIFQAAYNELHHERRQTEIVRHPRCLPCSLYYLSFREIYSYKLMDKLLDPEFIIETFGKHPKNIPRELFCLDPSIEIECPDYKGNRLNNNQRHKATKWNTEYTPSHEQFKKLTAADKLFLDVIGTVEKIVSDKSNYHIDHVLPHFSKADIIVCKNASTGQFIKVQGLEKYKLGDIMYPPKENNHVWYAIIVVGWNNTIRDTTKPLGLLNMKCRQLTKVGYQPILVIWNEFMPLNEKERISYIVNKIS